MSSNASAYLYPQNDATGLTQSSARLTLSASFTLFLAVVGSAILPIPYAFRVAGLGLALGLTAAVWAVNVYTSVLLVRSCGYASGEQTALGMEELASQALGARARTAMQLSLCVLLFGNMCGSFSVIKEVGVSSVQHFIARRGEATLPWEDTLISEGGWRVLLILVVVIILPLCLLRRMRQLEAAAGVGVGVLFLLSGYLIVRSIQSGMPGLTPHEGYNPWINISSSTPEALGVLGFSFYLQPQLLPMLRELPAGERGRRILEASVVTTLALTLLVYGVVGFFAAAHYGAATAGNILENISGRFAPALDVLVSMYLAIGVPPTQFSLRCTIEDMLVGTGAPFSMFRHVVETVGAVAAAFLVAAFAPKDGSAMIFSITGATGVCLACYVLPILIYMKMRRDSKAIGDSIAVDEDDVALIGGGGGGGTDARSSADGADTLDVPLLPRQLLDRLGKRPRAGSSSGDCLNDTLPLVVMAVSVVMSILALWGSLAAL